ncbi:FAS-associated factor 2 [Boothiomyces sp. JEL0838]|nr:FAS-associated factor 2 [Boothiomyces sp. JEL0838]KAJ3310784.1 FAS-associated factor 2 [Boothiomyces sp. JEL0838]
MGLAVEILENHDWDLPQAVESFLTEQPIPSKIPSEPSSSRAQSRIPVRAPNPVRTAGPVSRPTPSIFSLLTTPFIWGYKFLWNILTFTLSFLPFWRNRRIRGNSDPTECAVKFRKEFIKNYGQKAPQFFEGSYSNALDAAKRELRYMLAVINSEEHDDNDLFCRDTLTSDLFTSFIRDKDILVWAGSVQESEPFKVAELLGATKYPFMALIALHDSRMKVVHRFEGITEPDTFIQITTRFMSQLDLSYAQARAEKREREAARSIREQQDLAYQQSLKADREKAEKLKREQELAAQKEREEKLKEIEIELKRQKKREYKLELAQNLPSEPEQKDNVANLSVRLPNGSRLTRRFDADSKIKQLHDFIESNDLDPIDLLSEFVIVNTYPRKEYTDLNITFKEAGLYPSAAVIVEEIFEDD